VALAAGRQVIGRAATRRRGLTAAAIPTALALALALLAGFQAYAADDDAAKLGASLLGRHQGATEDRIVALMGAPATAASQDGGRSLAWNSPGGPGTPAAPACSLSAGFKEGKLASLVIEGHPQFDKKVCRKLAKPLLDASGPSGAQGAGAAITTLTNDAIVELVKSGLPTQAIIGRIRNEPCKFDLSNEATIALRRAGVNDAIIQAMNDRGGS
jgi:hypothetical protein